MKTVYILDLGFMKDVVMPATTIEAFEALKKAAEDCEARPVLYRSWSPSCLEEWRSFGRSFEWTPVDSISGAAPVKVWEHVPKKGRKTS